MRRQHGWTAEALHALLEPLIAEATMGELLDDGNEEPSTLRMLDELHARHADLVERLHGLRAAEVVVVEARRKFVNVAAFEAWLARAIQVAEIELAGHPIGRGRGRPRYIAFFRARLCRELVALRAEGVTLREISSATNKPYEQLRDWIRKARGHTGNTGRKSPRFTPASRARRVVATRKA